MFAIWAYSVRCWKVCPRELLDRRVNYYIHQLSWVKTYISIYGPLYSDRLNQHESQIAQRIILTHGRIGTLINDIIGYPLDACIAKIEPIQFVKRAEGFCFYIQNHRCMVSASTFLAHLDIIIAIVKCSIVLCHGCGLIVIDYLDGEYCYHLFPLKNHQHARCALRNWRISW